MTSLLRDQGLYMGPPWLAANGDANLAAALDVDVEEHGDPAGNPVLAQWHQLAAAAATAGDGVISIPPSLEGRSMVLQCLEAVDVSMTLSRRANVSTMDEEGGGGGGGQQQQGGWGGGSSAKRCLKLLLTDGTARRILAVEARPCPQLNNLQLGGKVRLKFPQGGAATAVPKHRNGMFMMTPDRVELLGGKVQVVQQVAAAMMQEVKQHLSGRKFTPIPRVGQGQGGGGGGAALHPLGGQPVAPLAAPPPQPPLPVPQAPQHAQQLQQPPFPVPQPAVPVPQPSMPPPPLPLPSQRKRTRVVAHQLNNAAVDEGGDPAAATTGTSVGAAAAAVVVDPSPHPQLSFGGSSDSVASPIPLPAAAAGGHRSAFGGGGRGGVVPLPPYLSGRLADLSVPLAEGGSSRVTVYGIILEVTSAVSVIELDAATAGSAEGGVEGGPFVYDLSVLLTDGQSTLEVGFDRRWLRDAIGIPEGEFVQRLSSGMSGLEPTLLRVEDDMYQVILPPQFYTVERTPSDGRPVIVERRPNLGMNDLELASQAVQHLLDST